jgi:hypothetical protein
MPAHDPLERPHEIFSAEHVQVIPRDETYGAVEHHDDALL